MVGLPNCNCNLMWEFRQPPDDLSQVFYKICNDLGKHSSTLLCWDSNYLTPAVLRWFCNAIRDAGAPLDTVFRFIDSMARQMTHLS